MHWMNVPELNIFVIFSIILFSIMIFITAWAIGGQIGEHSDRIKALENEVDKLKTEFNKYIKS